MVDNPQRLYRFEDDLMNRRFENKVAIVTGAGCVGAGWGNGRAIAVRLAEEGARVFAVDRDPARLAETLELAGESRASITTWTCDVTDSDACRRDGGGLPRRLRHHRRAGQQRRRLGRRRPGGDERSRVGHCRST